MRGVLSILTISLYDAGMRTRRRPDDSIRSNMSLGLNIALVLGVAVVATAVLGTGLWLVLGRPPIRQVSGWTTANSFEFAKIVLAVVGGVGAVVALVVAYRKQRLGEVADEREGIKLFAERFTKAADQLGSDKAPVRLAGMYALEDLGQGTPSQRQTIVNVLCAYLRMPYLPPVADSTHADQAENERRQQERQVRLAAQRILATHLRPGDTLERPVDTYWKDIDLDLTGATLVDIDFSKCRIRTAQFANAQFDGVAGFGEARFDGAAGFERALFGGVAWFRGTRFGGVAGFGEAQFGGAARFGAAHFDGAAWFRGARFGGVAGFAEAQFGEDARFRGAQFGGAAEFEKVRVRLDVKLQAKRAWPNGLVEVEPATGEITRLPGQDGKWGYLHPMA